MSMGSGVAQWLVSVVLVSLALNVFSAYIKDHLDRWFKHRTKRKSAAAQARRKAIQDDADILYHDQHGHVIYAIDTNRLLIFAILMLAIGYGGSFYAIVWLMKEDGAGALGTARRVVSWISLVSGLLSVAISTVIFRAVFTRMAVLRAINDLRNQ